MKPLQRGGFAMGLIVGLLLGLILALGVALYITKAPVPFVNKVPQRTAEQDRAEQDRNRDWNPNAPLAGKPPSIPPVASGSGATTTPAAGPAPAGNGAATATAPAATGAAAPSRDPAAILSGALTPGPETAQTPPTRPPGIVFFVQAGAFTRNDDAEQQRARLAMLGQNAKISERDQHGRVVYRVRVGPYTTRAEAEREQARLQASNIESQLVRVEQP